MLLLVELMLIYKNKYKISNNLIIKIHIIYYKLMNKLLDNFFKIEEILNKN